MSERFTCAQDCDYADLVRHLMLGELETEGQKELQATVERCDKYMSDQQLPKDSKPNCWVAQRAIQLTLRMNEVQQNA